VTVTEIDTKPALGKPPAALANWSKAVAAYVDRWASPLALLGSLALTFALYGRALALPFLFDDTIDLTRVEGRSYWSLLTSSEGYSYYRPIPFLIWKALRQLYGYYDAPALHLLPLLFHALAGWLLSILLRRLGVGWWAAFPALLFLTYPFSYQNVAIVGVVFHPLAGAAILASLYLYLIGRSNRGGAALVAHLGALLATAVALWSHESGIVVLPALAGLEAVVLIQRRQRKPSGWLLGHLVILVVYLVQYQMVEKAPFTDRAVRADDWPKAMFFLQGFSYPLSAQIRWFGDQFGTEPPVLLIAAVSALFVFGAYGLSAWRAGRRRFSLFAAFAVPLAGLSIGLVAAAPSMARLSWGYVENSPRLLYLVGIGAALFWGLLPALRFPSRRATLGWRLGTSILLLAVVVQSVVFVNVRLRMFEDGATALDGVVETGERYAGGQALFLNTPSWLALPEYEYPWGHFGVQLIPEYIGLDRLVYTSSRWQVRLDAGSMAAEPEADVGRYSFGPHSPRVNHEALEAALREGSTLYAVERVGDRFRVREAGRLRPGWAEERPDAVVLINDNVSVDSVRVVRQGDALKVMLAWNVLAPFGIDAQAVVELRDASGSVIERYAGGTLLGYFSPSRFQAGDRVEDVVWFHVPPTGTYTVWVGLRYAETDEFLEPGMVEIASEASE
jgi:hypothetical protein